MRHYSHEMYSLLRSTAGPEFSWGEQAKGALKIASAAQDDVERVRGALQTLLKYFGGPQGVAMQELGHDAVVELPVKVRLGDLIEAHEALKR